MTTPSATQSLHGRCHVSVIIEALNDERNIGGAIGSSHAAVAEVGAK